MSSHWREFIENRLMPDLSQYISIGVTLDKSQPTPTLRIIDNSNYPMGVAQTIAGILSVTQPDNITVANTNFSSPDIYWDSGALVPADLELRLDNSNTFQRGGSGYRITYTVRAPGYSDTVLMKVFPLTYTPPSIVISNNFDIFTPDLSVQDATGYTQSSQDFVSVARSWSADIISVLGVTQTISGTGQVFDLNYLGSYYDSQYDITLTIFPQWRLQGVYNFVTIIDDLVDTLTLYAQIPPTLSALQASLAALKTQLDAAVCDCNTYIILFDRYNLASSIYAQLVARGQSGSLAGLDTYVYQLEKIFNNNVNPTYVNTNTLIPPYDWGTGSGSVAWTNITGKPNTVTVEWLVGDVGFPGPGSTTFTNANLTNVPVGRVYVFRNGLPQFSSNPGDGDTYYSKNTADNFLTFSLALASSEKIIVLILPL